MAGFKEAPLTFKAGSTTDCVEELDSQGFTESLSKRRSGSERSFAASAATLVGLTSVFQRAVRVKLQARLSLSVPVMSTFPMVAIRKG